MGKIRPQIMAAILLLGALGITAVNLDSMQIVSACVVGIVGLGKDLLNKD